MLSIFDSHTDPYWNLAAEEHILSHFDEPVFRLWRNSDAVIVGRHQNARAEIDSEFVERNGIAVVRRLTGGGAVFHDLGNVNYSFFNLETVAFTDIIIEALKKIGLDAATSGRNDILLDGKKISGTAKCHHNGHTLEHGTLLFDASLEKVSSALKPRPEKYEGRSTKSVRSRIVNIKEFLKNDISVEEFMECIYSSIALRTTHYDYSKEDLAAIETLRNEKYSTFEWNFGNTPQYDVTKIKKFQGGLLELKMNVSGGIIRGMQISGDYFSDLPSEEFCALLIGHNLERQKIADLLNNAEVGRYFYGISPDELIQLFF